MAGNGEWCSWTCCIPSSDECGKRRGSGGRFFVAGSVRELAWGRKGVWRVALSAGDGYPTGEEYPESGDDRGEENVSKLIWDR